MLALRRGPEIVFQVRPGMYALETVVLSDQTGMVVMLPGLVPHQMAVYRPGVF